MRVIVPITAWPKTEARIKTLAQTLQGLRLNLTGAAFELIVSCEQEGVSEELRGLAEQTCQAYGVQLVRWQTGPANYGRHLNQLLAALTLRAPCDAVLMMQEDWELHTMLDVSAELQFLRENPAIGMCRYWYRRRPFVDRRIAGLPYVELSRNTPAYYFSNTPHIMRPDYHQYTGPFYEGPNAYAVELHMDVMARAAAPRIFARVSTDVGPPPAHQSWLQLQGSLFNHLGDDDGVAEKYRYVAAYRAGELTLSVVVATYRNQDCLRLLLSSLVQQYLPNFQVIVINEGGDRGDERVVQEFGDVFGELVYRYLEPETADWRHSRARNLGLRLADGRRTLFMDDDMLLPRPLTAAHRTQGSKPLVVGGEIRQLDPQLVETLRTDQLYLLPRLCSPFPDPRHDHLEKLAHQPAATPLLMRLPYSAPTELCRQIGGFDERFTQRGHAEVEMVVRLCRAGAQTYFAPELVAYHCDPSTPRSITQRTGNDPLLQEALTNPDPVRNGGPLSRSAMAGSLAADAQPS